VARGRDARELRTGELLRASYLAAARGLTLARLASIPLFLVLLVHTHREGRPLWRLSLLLLYVCIALSDVLDGRLARKAGAPSHTWGQVDAVADIAFTSLSLAAAAWLGYVGPWVPVGVAVLGGRFLLRNLGQQPMRSGRLMEDRPGKAAGVIYYLLVGAVALELAVEGESGRWWVARAGDVVFLYTLFLLLRRRSERPRLSAP
jgi:phosphatidylglycerophosphate synthase